ncbi:MAG: hypothetical protein IPG87_19055 [Saprospiraceae bacterium]|nr:hypothetical protein [Candidatus Vicinibacter affinis]
MRWKNRRKHIISKSKELLTAINTVKMDKLTTEEHTVWMKVMKDLTFDAEHIADTKDASLKETILRAYQKYV